MNRNLGGFTFRGFVVGFGLCLIVGVLIYRRFDFVQPAKSDDAAIMKISELETKFAAMQAQVDKLEARLNEAEARIQVTSQRNKTQKKRP